MIIKIDINGIIDEFNGPFRFLSNFYPCYIKYDGHIFTSAESAYQYSKTDDPEYQKLIINARPNLAKRLGRKCLLKDRWDKLKVMTDIIDLKFTQGTVLSNKLTETYPYTLLEGNNWGDTFWGVVKGKGSNWLGTLLMNKREELMK